MKRLNDLSLLDLAPSSLLTDEEMKKILNVVDIVLNKRIVERIKETDLDRIEELEEWKVDYLAVELHLDFYDNKLDLEKKRELVKTSVLNHMKKGTVFAVETVCSIIFGGAKVEEWYKYGGNPYFFKVSTLGDMNNDEDYNRVLKVINEYKNTRSWLEGLVFKRENKDNVYFADIFKRKSTMGLNMAQINMPVQNLNNNSGIISREYRKIKLKGAK